MNEDDRPFPEEFEDEEQVPPDPNLRQYEILPDDVLDDENYAVEKEFIPHFTGANGPPAPPTQSLHMLT